MFWEDISWSKVVGNWSRRELEVERLLGALRVSQMRSWKPSPRQRQWEWREVGSMNESRTVNELKRKGDAGRRLHTEGGSDFKQGGQGQDDEEGGM